MAETQKSSPPDPFVAVENVYDECRTARMNVLYYGRRLAWLQRWNLGIEVAIALGTSGTVATLAVWQHPWGKVLFAGLAGGAAVLGVLKPVLNLSKRVERVSKLWAGYNIAFNALRRATLDIKLHHEVRPEVRRSVSGVLDRIDQLSGEDDPAPRGKILARLQAEVNEELPADEFWWPASRQTA